MVNSIANDNLRWDINETRRLVELRFGIAQREKFNAYIKPYNHRLYHARYHFQEIQKLLHEAIDCKLPEKDIVEILLVEHDSFFPTLIKIEAHMISCAQSTHSVTDIFAHATYFELGINLRQKPLTSKNINFKNVINMIVDESFFNIWNCMIQLLNDDLYKDLEKLVNQDKHRGLAEPIVGIEPENQPVPYKLKFPKYLFDDKLQSECEFQEFLSPIFAKTSQMTVRTGTFINQFLQINY